MSDILKSVKNAERYISERELNPDWKSVPGDEWGITSGSLGGTEGSRSGLAIEVMQRRDVPQYAEKLQALVDGKGDGGVFEEKANINFIYEIYFIPASDEEQAKIKAGELISVGIGK